MRSAAAPPVLRLLGTEVALVRIGIGDAERSIFAVEARELSSPAISLELDQIAINHCLIYPQCLYESARTPPLQVSCPP